jgi:hypothetical protein
LGGPESSPVSFKVSSTETIWIVSGPIPDEYGNACFVVQVGDRSVNAFATPDGSGIGEADFDVSVQVMGAISEFRKQDPERLHACLREAAKLRRAAGHSTELAVLVPYSIVVRPDVDVRENGVRLTVDVGTSSVLVFVATDGAIVDGNDLLHHPAGEVQPESLLAARRAVLNFILAHKDQASAWGVDCELLDLLWT